MSEPLQSKDELLMLLGNCLIALSLSNDEAVIAVARAAADKHLKQLTQRFPDWREPMDDLKEDIKEHLREMM